MINEPKKARPRTAKAIISFRKKVTSNTHFSAGVCVTVLLFLIACPMFAQTMQPGTSGAARYVSAQGSDLKDGSSWSTAKNTISAAVRSCPASGRCMINVSSVSLSSALSVSRPDTTIQCASGTTISTAVEKGAPIIVRANGFQLTGCTFSYTSGVSTMVVLIPNSVSHVVIERNTFENQAAGPTTDGIIRVGNFTNRTPEKAITDVLIAGNRFMNVAPSAVSVVNDAYRVTVTNNQISTVVGPYNYPSINFQAVSLGAAPAEIIVSGNSILKGTRNNCIQVQSVNSSRTMIRNVSVTGNVCRIKPGASGATGYSMVGISGLTETGNQFNSSAETTLAGNAAFELAGEQNASVSGNVAVMGTKIAGATVFVVSASSTNDTRNITLTGNSVSMKVAGRTSGQCFYVGANLPGIVDQVTITRNNCDLSGSTTTGTIRGVWVQSNNASAAVRDGIISGNILIGTARVNGRAIHLERNSGTLSGWRVGQNNLLNWSHPPSTGGSGMLERLGNDELSDGTEPRRFTAGCNVVIMSTENHGSSALLSEEPENCRKHL